MPENDQDQLEDVPELPEVPEGQEDKIDWQAEARKRDGAAKRYKTKAEKLKAELEAERTKSKALAESNGSPSQDKKEFGYGEKAFLKASGITPEEYPLVQEAMKSTGKSLEDILESRYFQGELKDQRDARASKDAVPSATKRSSSTSRDSVDYWIAKGELPPADQRDLRQKVVNEKIKRETAKSNFSDTPVVR